MITIDCLRKQNAETSNAIIQHFASNEKFKKLSTSEGTLIQQRDAEDDEKLQKGINLAIDKGVLSKDFVPEQYIKIDVLGKTADAVADEILGHVATNGEKSAVIVICGLSGTGKGTTVSKLREKISKEGKQVVCWSNGNIFRSVTLLAATWCEQNCEGGSFDADKCLSKDNLASFMDMLEFGEFNGKYDTRIKGLGLDLHVSEVQNTDLKVPKVAKNIPTVAEVTQGEVVLFAADAIQVLGANGFNVLLEGREQTVNYVRTKNRFTLVLSDESLIGMRRAAQRMMAGALKSIGDADAGDTAVEKSLVDTLETMVAEI
uniref:(d)CMP kinase n=1 Tax=Leptocylindrus danicus TaxID=163516 RepID=A0A7S2LJM0_9STRA|mmetsp:Transcript_5978/g.8785  ORF Transcript_5978/g.8785 Transcript_5978/m.8785 type:complete len:317 (+) Transcript_5978:197-1147(+)|eukprot:CAMPEP_0116034460 /NCGR_PEP_ID=MMETSP0321-20121206/19635_1 /TAXON_ID=163516 /ORGANISM="Leptocylindrus danicus var. danicus, Strain B650" /LENGTH=316 /DNA_ID=CAMNT_0003510805 /DNA_START=141 /DNA_END=1091 /DNA_ORIENTATION=+